MTKAYENKVKKNPKCMYEVLTRNLSYFISAQTLNAVQTFATSIWEQ